MTDALRVLQEAVAELSKDSGNPRNALKQVLARICGIRSYELPREAQDEFVHLMDEVGYRWRYSRSTHLERMEEVYDHVDSISDGDCARLVLNLSKLEADCRAAVARQNPRLI